MPTYRTATPDDAEAIRVLMLRCVDDFTGIEGSGGRDAIRERIGAVPIHDRLTNLLAIVAEEAGRIVGVGALDLASGESRAGVSFFYTDPECRGQGIATRIHGMLESEAPSHGIDTLQLDSSLNAVGFYERLGYRGIRRYQWTLGGATITNLIMEKCIVEGGPA